MEGARLHYFVSRSNTFADRAGIAKTLYMSIAERNEIVFFDAAGTLIEVRSSVGEVYGRIANKYGFEMSPVLIQARFMKAFRKQPPMAFSPGTPESELRTLEYDWWRTTAFDVFAENPFPAFDDFFAEAYAFFATREAWFVFDDVVPTLEALRARGRRLAVVSNFDTRLEDLLADVGLKEYFDAIHISTRIGAEKPNPAIFHAALTEHGLVPEQALHVGDRVEADIDGALAAGIRKVALIDRQERSNHASRISRLDELLGMIG